MGCLQSKPKADHKEDSPSSKPEVKSSKEEKKNEPKSVIDINGDDEDEVRKENIEDFYELGREIGRGGFSVVVEGTHKKTGERFAIKCIKKTMVEGDDIKLLRREIKIMKRVNHPNILKLYEVFEDDEEFFLAMELFVFTFLSLFYIFCFFLSYFVFIVLFDF